MDERVLGWIGIATFGGLCLLCLVREAASIEAQIHKSGETALGTAGIATSGLAVNGRDLVWRGTAEDDAGIVRVGQVLRTVPGARHVRVAPIPRTLTPAEILEARLAQAVSQHRVLFLPNSAALVPDSRRSLDIIADILAGEPDAQIIIEGHTDSHGDPMANLELSQHRADAVRRHLVLHGIAPERLHARGFGDSAPIADNATAASRRENRRIVFRVKE